MRTGKQILVSLKQLFCAHDWYIVTTLRYNIIIVLSVIK